MSSKSCSNGATEVIDFNCFYDFLRYEEIFHNAFDLDSFPNPQQTSLFDSPVAEATVASEVYAASCHAIIYGKAPISTLRAEELSRMGTTSTIGTPVKNDARHVFHNNGTPLYQTWTVVDIQVCFFVFLVKFC